MRHAFKSQLDLGTLPIEKIIIPTHSRDELPPVLAGLQWIWTHPTLRPEILSLLHQKILANKKSTGRNGMELWQILVLGVVRLTLDADWDRMDYVANHDMLLLQMLGINPSATASRVPRFHRRTLRDNVALLDADLLHQINALVAGAGRELFQPQSPMQVRVDSYVLETDVHFPTDYNLLWDGARKCLDFIGKFLDRGFQLPGWRKLAHWRTRVKSAERVSSRASSGGGKNKDQRVKTLSAEYLQIAEELSAKLSASRLMIPEQCANALDHVLCEKLGYFHTMMEKQMDLLDRRVLQGQSIPASEKVYSLFEAHTEWINKGKAHPAVELGHRVLIATEQNQLILDYRAPAGLDVNESIGVAERLLAQYGDKSIASMSFDKGFTKAQDKELIELYIPLVVMPKRGKKTEVQEKQEKQKKFVAMRRAHSAVESAINALEHHGLNRCLDVGIKGFERYVGYGVMAYNLHIIGREVLRRKCAVPKAA